MNEGDHKVQEAEYSEYVRGIQDQILEILNKVKEEMGIDTPIDIQVREVEDE